MVVKLDTISCVKLIGIFNEIKMLSLGEPDF